MPSQIHPTAIIHPNVILGENATIGPYCIIGEPPRNASPGDLGTHIGNNAVIRSHTVIYAGNVIGNGFNTGHHVVIREENKIGDNVSIGSLSCIEHHVVIGNGVRIHSKAFIPEFCVLEENAWIGPNAVLTNARYPQGKNSKALLQGVTVRKGAKVGANVTVLPGIELKGNCLIGSGSVVVKDVDENAVMVGNPARKSGSIDEIEEYRA